MPLRPETYVVSRQQLNENDLDLIACEEAAGTGIPAIAKIYIIRVGSHELVAVLFTLDAAKLAIAERMEFVEGGLRLSSDDMVEWDS